MLRAIEKAHGLPLLAGAAVAADGGSHFCLTGFENLKAHVAALGAFESELPPV
jgi:hypothetical protein